MARVTEYEAIPIPGFKKGLNLDIDPTRVEIDTLTRAQNIRILSPAGEVYVRSGYVRVSENMNSRVEFIKYWRAPGGATRLVCVARSNRVWTGRIGQTDFDAGPFIDIGDESLADFGIGFASAGGELFVSSRLGTTYTFRGGDIWEQALDVPSAKHLLFRHNRLFAINTVDDPSRIWYSELGDYENFLPDNWIDVDPDDGTQINAVSLFGDDIVVFKHKGIYKLSGRTPDSFNLYKIDAQRGCVSPRAVAQLRGRLMFFDRNTGIWAFDGANLELLSEPINAYLMSILDFDEAFRASMYVGEDRLYVSIPESETNNQGFTYFADVGAWTEYTKGFFGSDVGKNDRYIGLEANELYRADPTSKNVPPEAGNIRAYIRTGWIRVGYQGFKGRVRRLELNVRAATEVEMTIRMYKDFDDENPYLVRQVGGGAAQYPFREDGSIISIDGWGNRLNSVMFEFEMQDQPFQLSDMTVYITRGTNVRGAT